jgi:N-methylhydantoinase A
MHHYKEFKVLAVDVGGTFTDVVALRDGRLLVEKVATDVHQTHRSVLTGAESLGVEGAQVFNHASTHGLNAIITRRIPKVGFLTTMGHQDMLDVGRIWRPWEEVTNLSWRRSFGDSCNPLVPRYLRRGIIERITASGETIVELDESQAQQQIDVLRRCNVEAVAICLINAYVDGRNERHLRALVERICGPVPVSISSEVSPLAKEYTRASTTVIDVCMKVIYGQYVEDLTDGLAELGFDGELNFADSAAMLVPKERAMLRPFRVTFAGPAAGTAASAHFGAAVGESNLVCADVGGTSCDISVITDGRPYLNVSYEIEHDLVVDSLSTDISSLGAGGGSLVHVGPVGDIVVGPDSAGANPGPACYGLGGILPTLTDAAVMIGIIDPERFLGGRRKLDPLLSRAAFERLDVPLGISELVRESWRIGLNNIAEGIFAAALKRGIDTRDYSLMAYGAAGPMMLPSMIEATKVQRVVIPPHPGLFSALGLLSTDLVFSESKSAYITLIPENAAAVNEILLSLEESVLTQADVDHNSMVIRRSFDGRLLGQSWETPFIEIPPGEISAHSIAAMSSAFHRAYMERNQQSFETIPVQAATFRVHMTVASDRVQYEVLDEGRQEPLRPRRVRKLFYLYGDSVDVDEFDRHQLCVGDQVVGPAIVREELSTTFVPMGNKLAVGSHGELIIN